MTRAEALMRVYAAADAWKVQAHPSDYDPTDDELVDLFLIAYNLGCKVNEPTPCSGDMESMGFGVHSDD